MRRIIASTMLAALALCAGLTQAAPGPEIVLYGKQGFQGKRIVLRNDIPNFENIGFNDRASSIRVVHGTWEFCTDAFFRGNCRVLGPGEYPDLGGQDNRISSARLVAEGRRGWGQGGGAWTAPGREWSSVGHGDVHLFHGQGFNGFLANLDAEVPNFQPLGFNDKVGSLIVRRGVWEFCTDAGFRGSCRTFTPGEYPDLGGHQNKYSSARPIAGPHRLEHR